MTQKHIGYRSWNDNFRRDMLPATTLVETPSQGDAAGVSLGGYTFRHSAGYVSMEAEHFYRGEAPAGTAWSIYPDYGRTRSAVALTPYTQSVDGSSLTYRFTLPDTVRQVKVHVIVKSTLDFQNVGGHECVLSLDGGSPQTVNFNKTLVDQEPYMYSEYYPTVARRVVEKVAELSVVGEGTHELTLRPRHPGIVFEKLVVDFGGYQPSYLFMDESEYSRK